MLDEEENALACTVRQNAQRLVAHLVYRHRVAALRAVGERAVARVRSASVSRHAGHPEWWREQEAALLALGAVARHMRRVQEGGPFDVPSLLQTLQQTAGDGDTPPYLRGRALLCASKYLRSTSDAGIVRAIFHTALAAMGDGCPTTLRLAACRAIRMTCAAANVGGEAAPAEDLRRAAEGAVALLAATEGETRYHVLLTLRRLIKVRAAPGAGCRTRTRTRERTHANNGPVQAAPDAPATMGPGLAPVLARLWHEHVSEPVVLGVCPLRCPPTCASRLTAACRSFSPVSTPWRARPRAYVFCRSISCPWWCRCCRARRPGMLWALWRARWTWRGCSLHGPPLRACRPPSSTPSSRRCSRC